ncbi:MAG: 3-hydroxyacyl-[acyl-carrier-protein] dehydratase [Synergistaceae bacterium]|nr:3-hydroxyacyl-[acyl-carrier-protein] dehydratase [Synergistaceae bacterium]MDI3531850.1 3-hydroxyacyl-[acyl-carrier-protein] dehydratase [Synergistaceae bacterium]
MIDIHKILESLPHRYPFLLVDRILDLQEGKIIGLKNVTINEPFFQGHFPADPVMPGVLVLESMGQVAAMMIVLRPEMAGKVTFLTGVDDARFRKPVRPGDQLITEAEVLKMRGKVGKVAAVAKVNGEVVAETVFTFVVAKKLGEPE